MKFEYRFSEGQFLPIVSLKLRGKEEWIESTAYVDSGASYSIFHAEIAEILGLALEEGELREMSVGDGNILKVYLHIGRKSIFERFLVCFNEKEKYVEFTPL